jgi:hypothetical protein
MYADGKPIVEITDMSLRLTGLTREAIRRTWEARTRPAAPPAPLFDRDRILAFAIGKPSEAFGAPYPVFDRERVIARLPGPPYQFLDRITAIRAEPWTMVAGGEIEAQYDVPRDAWYFAADRQDRMPFAVLLEVALQPCGWLAAYIGSALTSEIDLSFRNLGGSAVQLGPVGRDAGTLTTAIRITRVSRSGGMIIQHYDFEVRAGGRPLYRGDTYFGFFSKRALADQVGIREAVPYAPGPGEIARAQRFGYPTEAPFPDERLRMIDRVEAFVPTAARTAWGSSGGSSTSTRGRGSSGPISIRTRSAPGPWAGIVAATAEGGRRGRWGAGRASGFESVGVGDPHRWTYRGQVLPADRRVTVQAVITAVDDRRRRLKADGLPGRRRARDLPRWAASRSGSRRGRDEIHAGLCR